MESDFYSSMLDGGEVPGCISRNMDFVMLWCEIYWKFGVKFVRVVTVVEGQMSPHLLADFSKSDSKTL